MSRVRLFARVDRGQGCYHCCRCRSRAWAAGRRPARQSRWRHIREAGTAIAWSKIVVARFGKASREGVTALGKIDVELVLVDAYAAMIFVAAEHQLAVVPDFPSIFAAHRSCAGPALAAVYSV